VLEFYAECDFDYGISVDHVILDYQPEPTNVVRPLRPANPEWAKRQKLTLEYAGEFLRLHRVRRPRFQPLGVAQGWSPRSYAHAVQVLQKIGYRHIALGGMVPLHHRAEERRHSATCGQIDVLHLVRVTGGGRG
jgi:hypothetical protein